MRTFRFAALLAFAVMISGCSSSVDVLPLLRSVVVSQNQVTIVPYPTSIAPKLDGEPTTDQKPIVMTTGQTLTLADSEQTCKYRLVAIQGDVAVIDQNTLTKQANGHWQRDDMPVRVHKFVGYPISQ